MAQFSLTVEHSIASNYKGKETDSARLTLQKISTFLNGLAAGSYVGTSFAVSQDPASATVTLSSVAGVRATGSVALTNVGGVAAAGEVALSGVGGAAATGTVTLGGGAGDVTVVIAGTSVGPVPFNTDDEATAEDTATAINANGTLNPNFVASADGVVITIDALANGTAGNVTLTAERTAGTATPSGATLTGGVNGAVTVTLNGVAVGPVDVNNLSDTAAATAVAAALEANGTLGPLMVATGVATDVTIAWVARGVAGNVTLAAATATGTATRSAATLEGGLDGAVSVTIGATEVGPVNVTNISDTAAATAVAAAIELDPTLGPLVTAAGSTTNVTIQWNVYGVVGNAVALDAATDTGTAVRSAATLENGADNDVTVTVGGVAVVTDTTNLSNTDAATAVATALDADAAAFALVDSTAASNVVTLTAKAAGADGNGITLTAATDGGTATASGATLSGGTEFTYTL